MLGPSCPAQYRPRASVDGTRAAPVHFPAAPLLSRLVRPPDCRDLRGVADDGQVCPPGGFRTPLSFRSVRAVGQADRPGWAAAADEPGAKPTARPCRARVPPGVLPANSRPDRGHIARHSTPDPDEAATSRGTRANGRRIVRDTPSPAGCPTAGTAGRTAGRPAGRRSGAGNVQWRARRVPPLYSGGHGPDSRRRAGPARPSVRGCGRGAPSGDVLVAIGTGAESEGEGQRPPQSGRLRSAPNGGAARAWTRAAAIRSGGRIPRAPRPSPG